MLFYNIINGTLIETNKSEEKINILVGDHSILDFMKYTDDEEKELVRYLAEETKGVLMPKVEIHKNLTHIYVYDIDRINFSKGLSYEIYIKRDSIIIICEDENLLKKTILGYITDRFQGCMTNERLVIGLLSYIIKDDMELYRSLEETIADLEIAVLDNPIDTNTDITMIKKQLIFLKHYYEQIVEIAWDLEENTTKIFSEEGLILIKNFTRKLERINNRVSGLKEYITQVREAYQAQVDIRLNATMETFTVITAIFLPLTLLTSWYGMNFVSIKEYNWEYGYYFVMIAACCIALVMWIYFKKKNMFR